MKIYYHKFIPGCWVEILEETNKGYKVKVYNDVKSNKKGKIMYFSKIDFDKEKGLFI